MRWLKAWVVLMALLAGAPTVVHAQVAHTAIDVNLRAGPSADYPVIAIIPARVSLTVVGCLNDYRWCDVVVGPNRGWIYAKNILYPYQGAYLPILTYGAVIGLSIFTYDVGRYWDDHYRNRSWYSQRQSWIERSPPRFGGRGHRPPAPAPLARPGEHRSPPQAPVMRPGEHRAPPQAPAARPGERRPPPQAPAVKPGERRPQGQAAPRMGERSPGERAQGGRRQERPDRGD